MISLDREIETLRPILGNSLTTELVRRERREIFSLQSELRLLAWGGAMLLATAAGIVLKNNLTRIGPVALALLIGLASAACYAFVYRRRKLDSMLDDYVLLLGALLLSADVAFIETQFKLLGDAWHRHFLVVAVLHGIGAYVFRSRVVLTLAITALCAWLGVEWNGLGAADATSVSLRAFTAAAAVMAWRAANRREEFTRTFEHFAANLALTASLALIFDDDTRVLGCLLAMLIGGAVIAWGFRTGVESFVLYGFLYVVVAIDALLIHFVRDQGFGLLLVIVSMIGAVVSLIMIHARFKELRT
jgi:hypothetical protein